MRRINWTSLASWLLLFAWLDLYPYRGAVAFLGAVDFTLCYLLAVTFYYGEVAAVAVAVAAGVICDAATGANIHTPVYTGVFFAAAAIRLIVFRPGSVFHILFYSIIPVVAKAAIYYGTRVGATPFGAPWPMLVFWSFMDYLLFLLLLLMFAERGRMKTYKMSRI